MNLSFLQFQINENIILFFFNFFFISFAIIDNGSKICISTAKHLKLKNVFNGYFNSHNLSANRV